MAVAAVVGTGIGGASIGSVAKADVVLGQDWNPVSNSNGYTYFDGFTDYAGGAPTAQLQQVTRNGNNWLQYTNASGQYWGQLVGQNWANPAVVPDNVNANPRLEFDIDLSQYTWGRLMIRTDYNNDNGLGGQEAGSKTTDLSQLVAKNKGTIASTPNPFIEHVSIDLSSFGLRNSAAAWSELQVFLQPNFWGYWDADTSTFISQPYGTQTFFIDNMRLTSDAAKVNASWNVDAD